MITRPKDCQRGPMKELAKRAIVAACGVSLCSYQQSPNQAMGSTIRPFVQIAEEQPAHDQIPIDDAINKCVAIANIHPGLRFPAGWRFEAWLDVETAGETISTNFDPKWALYQQPYYDAFARCMLDNGLPLVTRNGKILNPRVR